MKPRIGADWRRLWGVQEKMITGEPLSATEQQLLADIVNSIFHGRDVLHRFWIKSAGRPDKDERDYWMALDIARLKHEGHPDPYGAASERWQVKDPERTLNRKKFGKLGVLPVFMIDHHRERLIKRK